jgi:anaerobic magnesium-protoporphyrin IX monomethyl ester cyclase
MKASLPLRVLLVNPPYQTFTSNVGVGHQVPLGLLMVGGPLLDAGHHVRLLDAECRHLQPAEIAAAARAWRADVVMTGHAGSTPAHPDCVATLAAVKRELPAAFTVYGGVFPSYHGEQVLQTAPEIDAVVRGEGEATAAALVDALATVSRGDRDGAREDGVSPVAAALSTVPGLTLRDGGRIFATPDRPPERQLDRYRVGWELIEDWDRYRCFGLGRAAIVQFSRGCPYRCTYCGQHGFWVKWRHRDPERLAAEIEWLHRRHDVRFVTLADENPTTLQRPWAAFLAALAARRLPVQLFATIRATEIVRDAELLPLYRRAGLLYVLMGVDSTDEAVLRHVDKRSTPRHDLLACRLLRQHGIYSILGHVAGFRAESAASLWRALRSLNRYGGDYLNAMFATPHDWTPFGEEALAAMGVVEPDLRRWDYRHPVLAQSRLAPWHLAIAVKLMELLFHLHPRRLARTLGARDRFRRRQARWTLRRTGAVWMAEAWELVGDVVRGRWRRQAERVVVGSPVAGFGVAAAAGRSAAAGQ